MHASSSQSGLDYIYIEGHGRMRNAIQTSQGVDCTQLVGNLEVPFGCGKTKQRKYDRPDMSNFEHFRSKYSEI